MPETFLILLAGGVLLAAAVSDPAQVTLQWLRLAGIIALSLAGLSLYFWLTRENLADTPAFFRKVQVGLVAATFACVLGQLAFVQVAWRRTQRAFAAAGFVVAVLAGANLIHDVMIVRESAVNFPPKPLSLALQAAACAGVAAMTGLALMDMLLGHAYLTASKMTMAPFRRLNLALAGVLVTRVLVAVGLVLALHSLRPVVPMLWGRYGLYMLTRWVVGLAVPAVFVYMAHDCIRRRATQSATGILYVAGLLVFIGELVGLYLLAETGLPF